jgi:carbonic anhydrase/acetyltransferase-like protein (isoleucine patch superfamily)
VPIYALGDLVPNIHPDAYVHPDATVIGNVVVGSHASIWPSAVLRGDYGAIVVGDLTSIQDGTVIHTTKPWPTMIGSRCVVGHNVHMEGCVIGDDCLIGSGSVVLNRARVEDRSAVAAAALVGEDSVVATGFIALGIPAKCRPAPADLSRWVAEAVDLYRDMAARYRRELRQITT